ncbi:MAG: hypothetical protein AAF196_14730 [Planctomycetota bacterium]
MILVAEPSSDAGRHSEEIQDVFPRLTDGEASFDQVPGHAAAFCLSGLTPTLRGERLVLPW